MADTLICKTCVYSRWSVHWGWECSHPKAPILCDITKFMDGSESRGKPKECPRIKGKGERTT